MTSDDLLKIGIGAIILLIVLIRKIAGASRRGGPSAAPQRTVPVPAAPPSSAQQRIAAMLAEMQRRGIAPPPSLQAIAAVEGVAIPPVRPPAPPPAPQPQHRHARTERPADQVRRPSPDPRGAAFAAPAAGGAASAGSTGRMLAAAFADPRHARNAVILAEILAPPVALR